MFPHFLINISNKQLFSQFLCFSSIIMEEAKVIQDKVDQINSLRQEKQTHVSNPESDLNLRLSLGGIYNPGQNPLTRSSSIAVEVVNSKRIFIEHSENTFAKSCLSVARASSLPLEMGSAKKVVNMKELRVMRRAEARKRAEEKHRNAMKGTDVPCFPTEIPAWAVDSAAKSPALHRAIGLEGSKNLNPKREIASEAETEIPNPAKKAKVSTNGCSRDEGRAMMERMPNVTITGDGPNSRRIQGFLYKYNRREVTIVCVCHGHFFSPEEFAEHAGCKDVTNPLKKISVFRTPFY